ncbi:MAG: hypothetical protein MUC49_02265 [Raineya sp.]|jgi:hypothetical protein|nr:hypothetical protein [Raineya sp.]
MAFTQIYTVKLVRLKQNSKNTKKRNQILIDKKIDYSDLIVLENDTEGVISETNANISFEIAYAVFCALCKYSKKNDEHLLVPLICLEFFTDSVVSDITDIEARRKEIESKFFFHVIGINNVMSEN